MQRLHNNVFCCHTIPLLFIGNTYVMYQVCWSAWQQLGGTVPNLKAMPARRMLSCVRFMICKITGHDLVDALSSASQHCDRFFRPNNMDTNMAVNMPSWPNCQVEPLATSCKLCMRNRIAATSATFCSRSGQVSHESSD